MRKIISFFVFIGVFFTMNAQVYNPVVNYYSNGTPLNGVKIKTKIPYTNHSQMPTIIIEGYNYGQSKTIGIELVYYIFNDVFIKTAASSFGAYTPEIKLANESGFVVIFINDKQFHNRFSVRAYAQGLLEQTSWFTEWTVVDEALNGSNVVTVPYANAFAGNINFPSGIWNGQGKVGIGTTSPKSQLHLASDADHSFLISRMDGTYGFRIFRNAQAGNVYFQIGSSSNVWETKIQIGEGEGVNTKLLFNPNGGNVGIGTSTPQNKLDVNGTIRAKEVKVETGWADFVFTPTYKLRPLTEVEQFIKTNGHLPEIPKAEEVKQNGVNLGEMQTKLLQKVEELTLYSIEQEKANSELKQKVAEQEKKLIEQDAKYKHLLQIMEELKTNRQTLTK